LAVPSAASRADLAEVRQASAEARKRWVTQPRPC
jgi:hypothetical protein